MAALTSLPNQHGPRWAPTQDQAVIAAIAERLAAIGGERFLTPELGFEDLSRRVARDGVVYRGPAVHVPGEPSRCHDNVAELAAAGEVDHLWGWALSDDGMWRIHSWGIRANGTLVETTTERLAYFGIVLTDAEVEMLDDPPMPDRRPPAERDMVKVHVRLNAEEAGVGGESMWATPVDGEYRLENVPFFVDAMTLGSMVTAYRDDGVLEVSGVVSHRFAATAQIIFDEGSSDADVSALFAELHQLGCLCERAAERLAVAAVHAGQLDRVGEVLDNASCSWELVMLPAAPFGLKV